MKHILYPEEAAAQFQCRTLNFWRNGMDKVECYCPLCEKTHQRSDIYWTGRGRPRIYCWKCREALSFGDRVGGMEEGVYHAPRVSTAAP